MSEEPTNQPEPSSHLYVDGHVRHALAAIHENLGPHGVRDNGDLLHRVDATKRVGGVYLTKRKFFCSKRGIEGEGVGDKKKKKRGVRR